MKQLYKIEKTKTRRRKIYRIIIRAEKKTRGSKKKSEVKTGQKHSKPFLPLP